MEAAAQDLSAIATSSVDVVTTRSVVIYVALPEKQRAFEEFCRVLRPGGRLSMFEPINRFGFPEPEDRFLGLRRRPGAPARAQGEGGVRAGELRRDAGRLRRARPARRWPSAPASTRSCSTTTRRSSTDRGLRWDEAPPWDVFLHSSGNPNAPTLDEALDEALSPEEREEFVAYLRPRLRGEQGRGALRHGVPPRREAALVDPNRPPVDRRAHRLSLGRRHVLAAPGRASRLHRSGSSRGPPPRPRCGPARRP